jgi:biotin carboxyl carrier protein
VSERKTFSRIALESGVFETLVTRKFSQRKLYIRQDPGSVKAAIPGIVTEITVKVGETVKLGDTLMILEAMKMLNRINALNNGTVSTICVSVGEKVTKGQTLIEIESDSILLKGGRHNRRKM